MFKGTYCALVTPFKDDLSINFKELTNLINKQIESGVDGLIICGTTSEATTLSETEKYDVIRHSVNIIDKRCKIIAGTGTNDTQRSVRFSKWIEEIGVDGLLIISPYYLKTNEEGIQKHFLTIADSVNTPIVMYNVPSRTNVDIPTDIIIELSKHKNIVGIKEASGVIQKVRDIKQSTSNDFMIACGCDDLNVEYIENGATSLMSVYANIAPSVVKEIETLATSHKYEEAHDLQDKHLDMITSLFVEPNPIPVKWSMNQLGYNVGDYRLPLCSPSVKLRDTLKKHIKKLSKDLK